MATHRGTANWHEDAFFGIHYDLHANAGDTELGRDLSVAHLVERLERVRPDWIQCDCKGHPGYTSWPTAVGSTSPGVIQDGLRMHRDATRQLGIPLGMHYSGVWDTRAVELHPDWARVDENGAPDGPNRPNAGTTNASRSDMTCRLSAYDQELMIPQMLELIDDYDVDGFWVDGENWASKPCWCERCTAEFTTRTGIAEIPRSSDDAHWDEWLAFHRDLFEEHVTAYANAVHDRKPGCLVCSNWMYTMRQPDPIRVPVDYLSGDFDHAWGANRAAVEGRLLDARGLSWDLMAWAFCKTGPFFGQMPWVMKSATHLCQEVSEVVALGGAVMIYDVPQRTGWLTDWHQDRLGEVADFCRARKNLCFKSQTVPQAAILHLSQHLYAHNMPLFNNGEAAEAVEGALHALLETGRSTDILPEDAAIARMNDYRLVVVPERTRPSEAIRAALKAYVEGGGSLLLTGATVTVDYPDLAGASASGDPPVPPGEDPGAAVHHLPVGHRSAPVYGRWQPVAPEPSTEAWTYLLSQQEPAHNATDQVVVTRRRLDRGSVVAVHGPLFENYFQGHYPSLRDLIRDLIDRMDVDWLVTLDAPPRLEMILRQKDGRLLVNLVNRGAGEMLSPRRVVVEELPPVEHVTIRVKRQDRPRRVSVFPEDRPADWDHADGVVTIRVRRVDIHSVVAIE
ncbi:MAG: alpha-L-fucosidase [Thermomicrobiales bacterium]